jgi:hypothetical protein
MVGGVSIWKLADDLNQERFFDGRLLVPETEGSDSLPTKVVWEVEGLIPLEEAQKKHPEETQAATKDLVVALDRVKKELASESSGYRRFKDALTLPSIDGAGAGNYFFDPQKKKLFVINWGASPRSLGAAGQIVFGYDKFDDLMKRASAAGIGGAAVAAAAAGGAAAAPAGADAPAEKKDEKAEEKKDEAKKRPLWFWLAIAFVVIILVVLLGWLLRGCSQGPKGPHGADAGLDGAASASPSSSAALGPDAGALSDGGDAGADASTDASTLTDGGDDGGPSDGGDAGDAGDAGDDGGKDGGKDAGKDGGETADNSGTPPEDGKVYIVIDGGGGSGSGSGSGGGGGAKPRPKPSRPIPFRSHFQPGAQAWRISSGADVVDDDFPPVMNNGAFEVYLKPGHTFSEIVVEYKDKSGNWTKH